MSITTVLFDLDGTLLPMDLEVFIQAYFGKIAARMASYGYEPKKLIESIWRGTGAMVKITVKRVMNRLSGKLLRLYTAKKF